MKAKRPRQPNQFTVQNRCQIKRVSVEGREEKIPPHSALAGASTDLQERQASKVQYRCSSDLSPHNARTAGTLTGAGFPVKYQSGKLCDCPFLRQGPRVLRASRPRVPPHPHPQILSHSLEGARERGSETQSTRPRPRGVCHQLCLQP